MTAMTTSPEAGLLSLWARNNIRDTVMLHLTKDDLMSCRLVCRNLAVRLAPHVFAETTIEFRSRTFTRPSRLVALERIGKYIETLTFYIPHTAETFLPPIINPVTGREQTFVYMPSCKSSSSGRPRYGSREMTDLLVKQYPPLFHAATDIPSVVHAFSLMRNLCHLKISCEGQHPSHRYRRSVVDYALISLRMAVEQAPLNSLDSLSLLSVHPAAVFYLQPNLGFGASPASRKRWSQIRHLTIHMASFPYEPGLPTDHLKLLHAYLQGFQALERLVFHWQGARGLSPISLSREPSLEARKRKFENIVQAAGRSLRPLKFPNLRQAELVNVTTDASRMASFILDHQHSLIDVNLQDTTLRTGTWDDALAPLTQLNGGEQWKNESPKSPIDVPIVLSPDGLNQLQAHRVIHAVQRRHDGLRNLAKTRAREKLRGKSDHMKRLLPSSVGVGVQSDGAHERRSSWRGNDCLGVRDAYRIRIGFSVINISVVFEIR